MVQYVKLLLHDQALLLKSKRTVLLYALLRLNENEPLLFVKMPLFMLEALNTLAVTLLVVMLEVVIAFVVILLVVMLEVVMLLVVITLVMMLLVEKLDELLMIWSQ
jgi:hypothetical protein